MEAWDQSLRPEGHGITSRCYIHVLFLWMPSTGLHQDYQRLANLPFSVPALLPAGGTGILTRCPSTSLFSYALGPTNPARMILGQEPLGFRRAGFSPALSLLMSAFALPVAPPTLANQLHCNWNAPLPLHLLGAIRSFGSTLSPVIFTAQENLTSELLRFL